MTSFDQRHQRVEGDQYNAAGDIITIQHIPSQLLTLKYLNNVPTFYQENLVGRVQLLEAIHYQLSSNDQILLLNGIGGIGKTTVAMAYVNVAQYSGSYQHIAWISFTGNIKRDLLDQLQTKSINFVYNPGRSVNENFTALLDTLRHIEGENLLVLDNVNDAEEMLDDKNALETLRWKIIITSRLTLMNAKFKLLTVDTLEPEEAKALFHRHYQGQKDDKVLEQILQDIEYHTLLIELLAKAATASRMTLLELYTSLSKQSIQAQILQVKIQIGEHANRAEIKKIDRLYNYILSLFELKKLSRAESNYLRYFAVLPSMYIDAKVDLRDLFGIRDKVKFFDTLNDLNKKGWLQEAGGAYACHPLIQMVVREKLKPNTRNCLTLIQRLRKKLRAEDNRLSKRRFIPYVESILQFIEESNSDIAALADDLSLTIEHSGDYEKALSYGLKALKIRRRVLDPDHPDLATSFDHLGLTYLFGGNYEKALSHSSRALKIRRKILSSDHPDLAVSYNNVGFIYRKMGECRKSLDHYLKALAIREINRERDIIELSLTYNNVSVTYRCLEDLHKALEYAQKALDIRERVLDGNHPDLGNSFNILSITYQQMGDLRAALDYGLKALHLRENVLPSNHPNLATSYHTIALIYHKLGDRGKAISYIDQAVKIRQETLPEDHPDVRESLNNQQLIYNDTH